MVLAELIDEAVHVRTGHRVRGLRVVVDQGHITLRGRCESFHIKQLAQHAVMRLGLDERLSNRIEVD
jgi:osmotically-inducible protein OsmY